MFIECADTMREDPLYYRHDENRRIWLALQVCVPHPIKR